MQILSDPVLILQLDELVITEPNDTCSSADTVFTTSYT